MDTCSNHPAEAVRGGAIQVVLGVAFWTGNGASTFPWHMALGTALVLRRRRLSGLGPASGIPVVLASAGFRWAALTVIHGMTQELVLAGTLHWMAQALHLAVGAGAVPPAVRIAFSIVGRRTAAAIV